jgi:hypothetical protein
MKYNQQNLSKLEKIKGGFYSRGDESKMDDNIDKGVEKFKCDLVIQKL